jgi:hypothetical protein
MNELTKEMFAIASYIYTQNYINNYFRPDWEKDGSPNAESKAVDNEGITYTMANEKGATFIPWHRVYGAAEWKAMGKAVKSGAEYAGIPQEYVAGLDYRAFKWGQLEKKITKEQYETLVARYKETYPVFFKAELAQWNYPDHGPWREAFEPPAWG